MLGDHRLATYDCKISAMSKSDGEKQDRALAAVQSLITKKLAKDPEIWKVSMLCSAGPALNYG